VVVGCVTTIGIAIAVTAVLSGWGADSVQWAESPSPDGSRTVVVYYQSGVGLWDKGSLRVKLADNRGGEEPREIASFTATALDFPEGKPLVEWTSNSTVRVGAHRVPMPAGQ